MKTEAQAQAARFTLLMKKEQLLMYYWQSKLHVDLSQQVYTYVLRRKVESSIGVLDGLPGCQATAFSVSAHNPMHAERLQAAEGIVYTRLSLVPIAIMRGLQPTTVYRCAMCMLSMYIAHLRCPSLDRESLMVCLSGNTCMPRQTQQQPEMDSGAGSNLSTRKSLGKPRMRHFKVSPRPATILQKHPRLNSRMAKQPNPT